MWHRLVLEHWFEGADMDERWDRFLARISDPLPPSCAFPKDRQEEVNLTDQ